MTYVVSQVWTHNYTDGTSKKPDVKTYGCDSLNEAIDKAVSLARVGIEINYGESRWDELTERVRNDVVNNGCYYQLNYILSISKLEK